MQMRAENAFCSFAMGSAKSSYEPGLKRYSQLKPTRAKLQNQNLHRQGGQTIPPSRASLQETVQLSEYDRVITKQLVESWLELAEVAKR